MTTDSDVDAVVSALAHEIQGDATNVIVAHGNDKHMEFNDRILAFASKMETAHPKTVVVTVEGQPGTGPLEKAKAWGQETGRSHFIPLMVVAGDHIVNDVMGDEGDSFKAQVGAETNGVSKPLGWNSRILDIYFRHLDDALARMNR
jgi:sirohydrochlorin cobaltochelatase